MRKGFVLCLLSLLLALTACTSPQDPSATNNSMGATGTLSSDNTENELPLAEYQVKLTAGDMELIATMNDTVQARDFAAQLPMTVPIYEPANFAKAFNLQEPLSDSPERTREYSIGTLAYWPEGPAVAIFFSDHEPQTVVPVIHIGQVHSGAEALADYEGDICIELLPDEDSEEESLSATQLQFKADNVELTAVLDDSPLSQELLEALPATLTMTRLYEREYYGTSFDWEPASEYETQVEFSIGDLAYWPRGNSLLLLFNTSTEHPTIDSGIVVIGKIQTDLSVFDGLGSTIEMTISVLE